MRNIKFLLIIINISLASSFSEKDLIDLLKNNSPRIKQIETNLLQKKLEKYIYHENFEGIISANLNYYKSDEKSLSSFMPVFSPSSYLDINYEKKLIYGTSFKAVVYSDQKSTTSRSLIDASTLGVGISFSVDLLKNFLGSLDQNILKNHDLKISKHVIEKKISIQNSITKIRKIYWALVANSESKKISNKILISSVRQLNVAKARLKASIADQGEVARYKSQVASRKANIIYLDFMKEELIKNLKSILPSIANKKFILKDYNIDNTISDVFECAKIISTNRSTPLQHSSYYTLLEQTKVNHQNQKNINKKYDSPDLILTANIQRLGKDYSFNDSISDWGDSGKLAYKIGLNFKIPLGKTKHESQSVLENINNLSHQASLQNTLSKMENYHLQTQKEIQLLYQIIAEQKNNTRFLSISLKSMKQKFAQARVSVREIIQDQNTYLSSNINEIETKQKIINTLLDYLNVFDKTPCSLNLRK